MTNCTKKIVFKVRKIVSARNTRRLLLLELDMCEYMGKNHRYSQQQGGKRTLLSSYLCRRFFYFSVRSDTYTICAKANTNKPQIVLMKCINQNNFSSDLIRSNYTSTLLLNSSLMVYSKDTKNIMNRKNTIY